MEALGPLRNSKVNQALSPASVLRRPAGVAGTKLRRRLTLRDTHIGNKLSHWYRCVESIREWLIPARVDTHTFEMLVLGMGSLAGIGISKACECR